MNAQNKSPYGTEISSPEAEAGVEVGGGEKAAAATDSLALAKAKSGERNLERATRSDVLANVRQAAMSEPADGEFLVKQVIDAFLGDVGGNASQQHHALMRLRAEAETVLPPNGGWVLKVFDARLMTLAVPMAGVDPQPNF